MATGVGGEWGGSVLMSREWGSRRRCAVVSMIGLLLMPPPHASVEENAEVLESQLTR